MAWNDQIGQNAAHALNVKPCLPGNLVYKSATSVFNGTETVFTVPAGQTWRILNYVHYVYNAGAATAHVISSIVHDGTTVWRQGCYAIGANVIASHTEAFYYPLPLDAGDTITTYASAANVNRMVMFLCTVETW